MSIKTIPLPDKIEEKDKVRFWGRAKLTSNPNKCWVWSGGTTYGRFSINKSGKRVFYCAHRLSYYISKGGFDNKLMVLHKCDNPSCVNPNHLFLGTQMQNVADMYAKKRMCAKDENYYNNRRQIGVKNPKAKLSESDVINIRERYASGAENMVELSRRYKVSKASISGIILYKNWKHI